MNKEKKQNIFARYFADFGIRQICDITMLVGAVLLIVGLFVSLASLSASLVILGVGLGIYIVASVLSIVRCVFVLISKINHRAPEYKRAIVNTVIMSVILVLSIVALVVLIVAPTA